MKNKFEARWNIICSNFNSINNFFRIMELEIKFEYGEVARVGINIRDDLIDKKLPGAFKKSVGITTNLYMRLVEQL